jgi:diaminopimelate decarboxylase
MEHRPTLVDREWASTLAAATRRFGTPCYVVRWTPVAAAVAALDRLAMPPLRVRSWLSLKTHPVPHLAHRWLRSGRGIEVVSEREFVMANSLGASVEQILVNGVAKHTWLPAHSTPGLRVHFDSIREADMLIPLAVRDRWRVGIRCHAPDECDARDPRFGGQFGMTAAEATETLSALTAGGADVRGVHFHLGQRPHAPDAYLRGVEHLATLCAEARFTPTYIDLGGGLPADAAAADALDALERAIARAVTRFGSSLEEVWLENGRFVTQASTALAVRVLDIKDREDSRYLICDGGRTNQALAADHGPHTIVTIPARRGAATLTTVCGPTCMTDDVLVRLPLPGDVEIGDVIGWMDAGAYHLPWETRFSHGLCAVVWSDADGEIALAREREEPAAWACQWKPIAA